MSDGIIPATLNEYCEKMASVVNSDYSENKWSFIDNPCSR